MLGRNVCIHSSSAYLAPIVPDGALFELQGLGLYTTASLPDIAHETESGVEYVYTATNVQSPSVKEKSNIIPNTFEQAMTLPTKLEWKATSNKKVASVKNNNVYTLLPAISVPTGRHKIIGSGWVYNVKADNSRKGQAVVMGSW